MKKIFLPIVVCLATAMSANAVDAGNANIYASGLKVLNGGSDVQFVLNAPGDVTVNFYKEGVKVYSIEKQGLEKGSNTISLTGVFPDNVKENDVLTWEVVASAAANETYRGFSEAAIAFENGTTTWKGLTSVVSEKQKVDYPCGVTVDMNPKSSHFGNIYMINSDNTSWSGGRTLGNGVYVYNPLLEILNPGENGATAYSGNISWTGGIGGTGNDKYANIPVSPYAVTVDEEGYVYISDWSGANAGVYMMDPANPEADFKTIIKKTNGNCSYVEGLCVEGTGNERVLYTVDESAKAIYKYNIGDLSVLPYTDSAEKLCDLSTNGFDTGRNTYLVSDRRGGVWAIQRTSTTTDYNDGKYVLIHVNSTGSVSDLNGSEDGNVLSGTYGTNTYSSQSRHAINIASNSDGSELAIGIYGGVEIKTITFNEDGTVASIERNETKSIPGYDGSTNPNNAINHIVLGVSFDVADNVYVADYSDFFQAYALPKVENTYTTPANELVTVSKEMTGVERIVVDENAPVEYFNMQGVKVNAPENGIFIKKQAGKTSKVIL